MFAELTGESLEGDDPVFVEKYKHGGMSSGQVSREFWRDSALPLLMLRHGWNLTADKPDAQESSARLKL